MNDQAKILWGLVYILVLTHCGHMSPETDRIQWFALLYIVAALLIVASFLTLVGLCPNNPRVCQALLVLGSVQMVLSHSFTFCLAVRALNRFVRPLVAEALLFGVLVFVALVMTVMSGFMFPLQGGDRTPEYLLMSNLLVLLVWSISILTCRWKRAREQRYLAVPVVDY